METWGPAVGAGDAEIDEELCDRFGGHRGALIGVQGQLAGFDVLAGDGGVDELLGELTSLCGGDDPRDDVAGVDVDDDEQLVV